ncbi:MAG: hypothetical protein ACTIC1_02845 [Brevibacterium sp.]
MFRIFPSVPITWRSSSCVQFGVEDPVLIDGLLPADVSLVEDLRLGVGSAQYYSRAQDLGVDLSRASSLITLLGEAGVLIPEDAEAATVAKGSPLLSTARTFGLSPDRVSALLASRPVMAIGPLRSITEQYLSASGFATSPAVRVEELDLLTNPIVITSSYLVPDLHTAIWLTDREIAHCQVVIGEQSVEVTGLIRPGSTPCTICTCLHRRDVDEEWLDQFPRLRALPDRESLADPLSRVVGGLNVVLRLRQALLGAETEPLSRLISLATGAEVDEGLDFHPSCHCRVPVPHFDSVDQQAQ